MKHFLLATTFLVVIASTIRAARGDEEIIRQRPAYCPGVTANNLNYILKLAVSTAMRKSSLTLPAILTYEDKTTIMNKLEAYSESSYDKCKAHQEPVTSGRSTPGVCSSEYQCDYDPGRFPQYIIHVVCNGERVEYDRGSRAECQCRPIYRPLTVLKFAGCNPNEQWSMEEQSVSVGCTCLNTR